MSSNNFKRSCYGLIAIGVCTILHSCGTHTGDHASVKATLQTDTTVTAINSDSADNYALYYINIADTGQDYYTLRATMVTLQQKTQLSIDTMGRYYNAQKKMIVLPDTADDEMYRGDFYPRRDVGEYLSLEYYNFFDEHSTEKNIALVSGIYETDTAAGRALRALKPSAQKSFTIKSTVFIGCMH